MSATRLRISSDGTPAGTKVTTEDGTLVKGIQAIEWRLEVGGFARVNVEILAVAADLIGLVETEDGSFPEDPTSVPRLAEPQDPPNSDFADFTPLRPVDTTREDDAL